MSVSTTLMLSENNELTPILASGHFESRLRTDIGVYPPGMEIQSPVIASVDLEKPQTVNRITIEKDSDGKLFITLVEK